MESSKNIKIGSKVRLLEEQNLFGRIFPKGHIFTVYGSSYRGWDLIDANGEEMCECLFIHDKLELYDIKEVRMKKLKKINSL